MNGNNLYFDEPNTDFAYHHSCDKMPKSESFRLHNHNDQYEILLFLSGDAAFRVEGTTYYPRKNDILIARTNEMHQMVIKGNAEYERIVINVFSSFFTKNNCEKFKGIFINRELGSGNLIHADEKTLDIFKRMEEYILINSREDTTIIIKCVLTELLYNINKNGFNASENRYYDEKIKEIIIFINENIRERLTLDDIAEYFYINKFHLCHTFKKHTGLTVNKYITYKRILLVREYYSNGMSITEASLEAGFGSYSNFYKMYCREMGKSPREDLSF